MNQPMDEVLNACIAPLREYLDQIVVAGGWVPYLYVKAYEGEVAHDPLLTGDFDAAIARQEFVEEGLSLDSSIIASGFSYDFASLDTPPVVKYVKKLDEQRQAEIEFITEIGPSRRHVEVIGSINAQALAHVDLLLRDPWSLPLSRFGLKGEESLRLPRPAMYILHKILAAPQRKDIFKTAKDLYYAFYVLDAFPVWRTETYKQLATYARSADSRVGTAARYLGDMFADVDSRGTDYLVSQRPQTAYRPMNEDQFRQYCTYRMRELLSALKDA